MDHPFRSAALGGFNRQDVLDYLEKTSAENAQRQQELQQKLEAAEEERGRLAARGEVVPRVVEETRRLIGVVNPERLQCVPGGLHQRGLARAVAAVEQEGRLARAAEPPGEGCQPCLVRARLRLVHALCFEEGGVRGVQCFDKFICRNPGVKSLNAPFP